MCQDLVEQVNDISALMKELNLKNWRDLDTSEEDSKRLRATFSEVGYGFFLFSLCSFEFLPSKAKFPDIFIQIITLVPRRIFAFSMC